MPVRRKINLEKVRVSLATPCPQCGHEITPAELLRVTSTQVRCPKYGATITTCVHPRVSTVWKTVHNQEKYKPAPEFSNNGELVFNWINISGLRRQSSALLLLANEVLFELRST